MAAWQAAATVWLMMWTAAAMRGPSVGGATGGSSTAAFEALNSLLRESLVIECQRTGIRVSFKRPILEPKGIPPQALSFHDTSCRASSNGTHYVLTTTFAACGGVVNRDRGMIYNSIKLLDPADVEAVEISRTQPSFRRWSRRAVASVRGDDEDDEAESSGSGDGSVMPAYAASAATAAVAGASVVASSPGPDLGRMPLLSVLFGCDYSNRTRTQASIADLGRPLQSLAARWKLNMSIAFFTSDSFVAPLQQYPLRVTVGDDLFVQVSPEGGGVGDHSALRVVVDSCYLSSTADEGGSKLVSMIERGCPSHGSLVTWHGEDELASHRRFSFRVAQHSQTFTFLHCSVDLCSLRPLPSGVDPSSAAQPRPCTTQADHCALSSRSDADRIEAFRAHSGPLLIVSSKQPSQQPQQPRQRDRPLATGRNQQQQPHAFVGSMSTAGGRRASSGPAVATAAAEPPTAVAPALLQPQSRPPPSAAGRRGDSSSPVAATTSAAAAAAAAGGAAAAGAAAGGSGLPVGTVIGIAVGAFVVGCATVGALWLIHTCTDPRRRLLSVPTTEDSGSQTSRSPMSV